jgi:MoxR-like ATPase
MKIKDYSKGESVNAGCTYRVNGYLFTVNAVTSDGRMNIQVVDPRCQLQVLNDTTLDNLHRVLGLNDPNEPVRHEVFQEVLNWLQMGENVYLYGPAGTGKNVLAQQLADELGQPMFFMNKVTDVFDFKGSQNANGDYIPSAFYRAFTEGGLFFFDEFDASCENAITALNAALANKYFDFPVLGNVKAHKNFRVVAAGNTSGKGATAEYNGRNKLDDATLNRFAVVEMNYDPRIEERCAEGDSSILDYVRELRRAANQTMISLTLGYRNLTMLAKAKKFLTDEKALQQAVFKGMDTDEIRILHNEMIIYGNHYAEAMEKLARKGR